MMKNPPKKKRVIKIKHKIHNQLDCHNWASKMEIQRLVSSKPFVKIVLKSIPTAIN